MTENITFPQTTYACGNALAVHLTGNGNLNGYCLKKSEGLIPVHVMYSSV